jgi:outer membrane protein assembly factor BamB
MFRCRYIPTEASARAVTAIVIGWAVCLSVNMVSAQDDKPRLRESVSLDTDDLVVRLLDTVREHVDAQQWGQAVELLEDIVDRHAEKLVPVERGRYVNVGRYANLMLASLPKAGLSSYRKRIDPQTKRWFETGRDDHDTALLQRVIRRGFASSYGDDALQLLGDLAWQRGEIGVARSLWTRILPLTPADDETAPLLVLRYPDSDLDTPSLLARLVLCSLAEEDRDRTARELALFRERFPNAEGLLAGRSGKLVDILQALAADSDTWNSRVDSSRSAVTFAGNARRNNVTSMKLAVGAPSWSVPLNNAPVKPQVDHLALRDRGPLSHHPVVAGNVVLAVDTERVLAWDLATGQPWPDADDSPVLYPSVAGQRAPQPFQPTAGVPRFTLTVDSGRLYAMVGSPVTVKAEGELSDLRNELICLDLARGQGKLVWKKTPLEVSNQQAGWSFDGAPLVVNGRLFALLRRGRPETQIDLVCLDADTANVVWRRKICAADVGITESRNFISHLLPIYGDGAIFLSTNTGAIAAVNADTGSLQWVVTYESHPPSDIAELSDHTKQGLVPCLYDHGVVFAAPTDSPNVIAIDAATGVVGWRRRLPDRVRHLIGVSHGRLIASGNSLWALDTLTGRLHWKHTSRDPAHFGYGRGLLTGETVWWPKREAIERFDVRTGRPVQDGGTINLRRRGGTGGNLFAADGMLLVTEPRRIVAYGRASGSGASPRETISFNRHSPLRPGLVNLNPTVSR